jgi:hypothetical protein
MKKPEAGELWEWFGGQKFLLLGKTADHHLGVNMNCLNMQNGEIKNYLFQDRDIGSHWRFIT